MFSKYSNSRVLCNINVAGINAFNSQWWRKVKQMSRTDVFSVTMPSQLVRQAAGDTEKLSTSLCSSALPGLKEQTRGEGFYFLRKKINCLIRFFVVWLAIQNILMWYDWWYNRSFVVRLVIQEFFVVRLAIQNFFVVWLMIQEIFWGTIGDTKVFCGTIGDKKVFFWYDWWYKRFFVVLLVIQTNDATAGWIIIQQLPYHRCTHSLPQNK